MSHTSSLSVNTAAYAEDKCSVVTAVVVVVVVDILMAIY